MQFEYALGTKMGEVLNTVQNSINKHRKEFDRTFMTGSMSPQNGLDAEDAKADEADPESANIGDGGDAAASTKDLEADTVDGDGDGDGDDPKEDKSEETEINDEPNDNATENEQKEAMDKVVADPLSAPSKAEDDEDAGNADGSEQDEELKEETKEENPLLVIEEALAELKLVKDALLGNLDETQLESWLNWTFVEPSPEPNQKTLSSDPSSKHKRKKPAPSPSSAHKRNLSSSGLPPPKKGGAYSKPPALHQHPLD